MIDHPSLLTRRLPSSSRTCCQLTIWCMGMQLQHPEG